MEQQGRIKIETIVEDRVLLNRLGSTTIARPKVPLDLIARDETKSNLLPRLGPQSPEWLRGILEELLEAGKRLGQSELGPPMTSQSA